MKKTESQTQSAKVKPRAYLREWRIHQGLTLQDVADRMGGYHGSQVSQWETGGRGLSETRILEFCGAIGIDIASVYKKPPYESIDVIFADISAEKKAKVIQKIKFLLTII